LLCVVVPVSHVAALAQPPAATPEREYPSVKMVLERNLEYGKPDGRSLMLDLYRPRQLSNAVPMPVLVWIHGEEGRFAGRYPCPIASMIGNGYAVASIDYARPRTQSLRIKSMIAGPPSAGFWPTPQNTISTPATLAPGAGRKAVAWPMR